MSHRLMPNANKPVNSLDRLDYSGVHPHRHQSNARDQILWGKEGTARVRLFNRKAVFDPHRRQAEGMAFASKIRTRSG